MSEEIKLAEVKAQAISYLLLGLLQRLDREQPGLIDELLSGVKADRDAALAGRDVPKRVPAIFDEAIRYLERANNQSET